MEGNDDGASVGEVDGLNVGDVDGNIDGAHVGPGVGLGVLEKGGEQPKTTTLRTVYSCTHEGMCKSKSSNVRFRGRRG